MSDFHHHQTRRSMDRAQRAYDNQMPPDDESYRECDQCNEEYDCEFDEDGEPDHKICPKCRQQQRDEEE